LEVRPFGKHRLLDQVEARLSGGEGRSMRERSVQRMVCDIGLHQVRAGHSLIDLVRINDKRSWLH